MCPKCSSTKVFVNQWSKALFSRCVDCGHEWEQRPSNPCQVCGKPLPDETAACEGACLDQLFASSVDIDDCYTIDSNII